MEIEVRRFLPEDIDVVCDIQRASFKPLYDKYHDDDTSPYTESRDTVLHKYTRDGTCSYLILLDGVPAGAVRIGVRPEDRSGRISALCVLPRYQGRGLAQAALLRIEQLHSDIVRWNLDTILEEPGNCHLYEKLGYVRTGKTEKIRDNMTRVFYEKKRE